MVRALPRRLMSVALGAGLGLGLVVGAASPAGAHAFGGRADLPLPVWMFAYGAGGVLLVSFAALAVFWPTARLEPAPATGGDAGGEVGEGGEGNGDDAKGGSSFAALAARILGLVAFAVVLGAAFFGPGDGRPNLAIPAVFIAFWIGLTVVSALLGDVWRAVSPFPVLAAGASWMWSRMRRGGRAEPREYTLGHWPAALFLFGFVWLELAYPHSGDPRAIGVAIVVYAVVVVAGALRWGRPWLRQGDAFAAYFGLLAHMAPLHVDRGRLRLRPPFVGLAAMKALPGTAALALVALGSTSFDGLERTKMWLDATVDLGTWALATANTLGMIGMIAVAYVAYTAAMKAAATLSGAGGGDDEVDLDTGHAPGREADRLALAFVHSLVPIAFAYAVAHYFSYLLLEGQATITLASDPFGRGWDLFGTAGRAIDYGFVSPNLVAWVQLMAIVGGHVAGVVLAHDRALALFSQKDATRSQYPLLAAMILFTVGGLGLLFST